jgi:hypothetical protein
LEKAKKEKPTPKKCVCGADGIIVKSRSGKTVSCPDPLNCKANLRTMWNKNQDSAIVEWNGLVDSFYAKIRNKE